MTIDERRATPVQPDLRVELLPLGGERVELAPLISKVRASTPVLPFDESRISMLADFARRLRRHARGEGELQALAYWLRRAELARMADDFRRLQSTDAQLMPRGLAFHIPPSNVGTIFVYSLAMALITGNSNIVRMSSRSLSGSSLVLDVLHDTLAEHPQVAESVALVSYEHSDPITALLSHSCDVRVIWGGDDTVDRVRLSPLQPHAKDITFADRFSLAAIAIGAYAALPDVGRDAIVEKFFNDTFWFDQLGCSSPRALVWVGEKAHEPVASDFHRRLEAVLETKGYITNSAVEVAKLNQAYRSVLDLTVATYDRYGTVNTVLGSTDFPAARGEFCGGGLLYQWHVEALRDIVPHVRRKDQTLTVFGFTRSDVEGFVKEVAGRGVDRVVSFGNALNFGRFWDGYDLFAEFTRRVSIDMDIEE